MAKKARKISLNTGANDRARLVMDHTIWRQAAPNGQCANRAAIRDRVELGPARGLRERERERGWQWVPGPGSGLCSVCVCVLCQVNDIDSDTGWLPVASVPAWSRSGPGLARS